MSLTPLLSSVGYAARSHALVKVLLGAASYPCLADCICCLKRALTSNANAPALAKSATRAPCWHMPRMQPTGGHKQSPAQLEPP